MKKIVQKCVVALGLIALTGFFSTAANAETTYDHAVGISYISGFSDVYDFYDDIPYTSGDDTIPIGLAYNFIVNFDNGFRVDAGLGPIALIGGDYDYYDVPIRMLLGFTMLPESKVRPYVKAGASYHISDGDYMTEDPGFGLLGSIGIEFGKRGSISGFIEASYDTAEATFEYNSSLKREIEVHGFVVSAGVVF